MNTNKKVSLLVVFALVTSLFSGCLTAFAEQHYTDVDDSHWASAWVNYMHEKGYIHGYPDGTYLPGNSITRAEFVTILNYITKSTTPAANQFTDNHEGDWYYNQINCAVQAGYLHGYGDGTVKPNSFITREEAAVVIAQAYGAKLTSETEFADMDQVSTWALPYVKLMKDAEMVKDSTDNRFRPKDNLLRAEAAAMIYGIEKGIESGDIETVEVVLPKGMTPVENQDGSFKFSDVIGTKNTNNKLSLVLEVVENTAGDFSVTYTKDGKEYTVTPDELKDIVFTENELQQANFVFNFKEPKNGTSAKITAKVTDDGKVVSDVQTYEFTFGTATASPTPSARPSGSGTISGGGTSDKLDINEDRVVKALKAIQKDIYSDINNGSRYLKDAIEIILANDGMDVDDITSPQASKAEQGAEELKKYIHSEKYDLLADVYVDVVKYVVANSDTMKNADIETETKKDYVLYFRAMIQIIDAAADDAVAIYNANADKSADEKFNLFIMKAADTVISTIDTVFAGSANTDLKNEIKTLAVQYCTTIFTNNKGNQTIKDQLGSLTGDVTLAVFAGILKDHLLM